MTNLHPRSKFKIYNMTYISNSKDIIVRVWKEVYQYHVRILPAICKIILFFFNLPPSYIAQRFEIFLNVLLEHFL